jgi:hypothetical protein
LVAAVYGVEDECAVFDGVADGANFVHGPTEGHCAVATDVPEGGA